METSVGRLVAAKILLFAEAGLGKGRERVALQAMAPLEKQERPPFEVGAGGFRLVRQRMAPAGVREVIAVREEFEGLDLPGRSCGSARMTRSRRPSTSPANEGIGQFLADEELHSGQRLAGSAAGRGASGTARRWEWRRAGGGRAGPRPSSRAMSSMSPDPGQNLARLGRDALADGVISTEWRSRSGRLSARGLEALSIPPESGVAGGCNKRAAAGKFGAPPGARRGRGGGLWESLIIFYPIMNKKKNILKHNRRLLISGKNGKIGGP